MRSDAGRHSRGRLCHMGIAARDGLHPGPAAQGRGVLRISFHGAEAPLFHQAQPKRNSAHASQTMPAWGPDCATRVRVCADRPPTTRSARWGPRPNTVHLTISRTMMINKAVWKRSASYVSPLRGSLPYVTLSHRLRGGLSNSAPFGAGTHQPRQPRIA